MKFIVLPYNPHNSKKDFKYTIFIGLALIILTAIIYGQVWSFDFINYDDTVYIANNNRVQEGLSWENFKWAFGFSGGATVFYWHPVTWLSYMLDTEIFGVHAGGHHLVNVFFHAANALILFLVLRLMTGAYWESAFVAALFAVHPLNVESVAWISERKNVLSTFFWLLCMLSYAAYAKKPDFKKYLMIFPPFILGLMTKPMVVTLPCALLLLDYWPLKRFFIIGSDPDADQLPGGKAVFKKYPAKKLVLEKIPLLSFSIILVIISLFSVEQKSVPETLVPLSLRLSNAVIVYIKYLGKLVWPTDMAIFYPFPETVAAWQVITAGLAIGAITGGTIYLAKKAPFLAVGWLWYLGTMLPVIGISQHGLWPEMADRWIYIPAIGLFIMLAWTAPKIFDKFQLPKLILPVLAAVCLVGLTMISWKQASFWKNSGTISAQALAVTENNMVAHFNYACALANNENWQRAIPHYKKALAVMPYNAEIHNNLGSALARTGQLAQAIDHFEKAVMYAPGNASAHYNLANAYGLQGKKEMAMAHYKKAKALKPNYAGAKMILSNIEANSNVPYQNTLNENDN